MRIIFDNIVFSLQRRGGISVVWKELVSRFIRRGCDEVSFIEYETNSRNMFHEEIPLSQDNMIKKHPFCFVIERYSDIKIDIQQPFIFHSSYFRLCSNKNAINVTTVHDFTYEFAYKGRRKGAFLHLWQRNRAIRKADAVVCISESTKHDLMRYLPDVSENKIHVIHNAASSEYKLVDDKIKGLDKCLLFVGARGAYKNAAWLAECIKETEYKIIFCGSSMSKDEKAFYDSVLGEESYEVKVGLSNSELNRYYNSVKCLVYPSLYEGFGIPIIEAQSAGCPVIAYNTSSIPEVIGETPLLLQDLTKEELLCKLALLDDEKTREEVVNQGLKNAKRFSWDRAYVEYHNLYESLIRKTC